MADRFNLGSFVEAIAYAGLEEIFATFRSDDGFARPNSYEVTINRPANFQIQNLTIYA